jgi:hypothetical protein
LAPVTLAFWEHRRHEDHLAARPCRRCHRSSPQLRNQAVGLMHAVGPGIRVAAVQATFPDPTRREAENLRKRLRHLWKLDNGSGFITEAMRGFLDHWQVRPLFSPLYTPEYNGAIEAGNGALKTRTHEEAARQGRSGHWTADDTEAARRMANEFTYPDGPLGSTRHESFCSAPRTMLEARVAFGCSVEQKQIQKRLKQGYPLDTDLGHRASGTHRPCGYRLCSRRARPPYFHPEVNYSIN